MAPFYEIAHTASEQWRERKRGLDEVEQFVREDPAAAERLLVRGSIYWWRVWRRRYRKVRARTEKRVVAREDGGSSGWLVHRGPNEALSFWRAEFEYLLWDTTVWAMQEASEVAKADGRDWHLAACEGFLAAQRFRTDILSLTVRPEKISLGRRRYVAARLTGLVAAQVSLTQNKRLAAVLSEGGNQARDRLWQELPAAVMSEWKTELSVYSTLLRRVTHTLEEEGSEQRRLERDGKLVGEPADAFGADDGDLAEFERQEMVQYQMSRLKDWVENARFSDHEARVYELDMQTDFDTAAAARELEVKPTTVRVLRKRYIDKMRKVAGL